MSDLLIEKKVSNLVEYQFPEFYRTDGPVFVQFVKEYYKWLEGKSYKSVKQQKIRVSTNSKNKTITTNSFSFYDYFSVGDKIAIYEDDGDYRIYDIEAIINDNEVTLVQECHFTGSNQEVGKVVYLENVNYHARRLFDYDDIDNTVESFVVYFKEKYLKNIQFETETNTRQLVKHALDIYRSKGSERAVDLLFKLVFGAPANFYYPKNDLFKLSDGKWHVPKYLELELNENSQKFVNKQIVGSISGATAFAEALVRRTVKGKLVDVLYISAINGNFQTKEIINSYDKAVKQNLCPRIVGSLSDIIIQDKDGVGENYSIGDIVDAYSVAGEEGKARVTEISNIKGVTSFLTQNTGYAYSAAANVYISSKVLVLSNVVTTSNSVYFDMFEKVTQPIAQIDFNAANTSFVLGESIQTYHANNLVKGVGKILNVEYINSSSGTLTASIISGNVNSNTFYTTSNVNSANTIAFTDKTAVGNVVAYSTSMTFNVSNVTGNFISGEQLIQKNSMNLITSSATINNFVSSTGANGFINIINNQSVFKSNNQVLGSTSGASAFLDTVNVNLGVKDIVNDFFFFEGNYIVSNNLLTTASVFAKSDGAGAAFQISNNLLFSETISLNTDYILPYQNVALNATTYGFVGNTSANVSTIIVESLVFANTEIGRPHLLVQVNKGQNYSIAPIVRVIDPLTYCFNKSNKIFIEVDNPYFYINEIVTQASSNARGIVTNIESNTVTISMLRFLPENNFTISSNSLSYIVGEQSALSANVLSLYSGNNSAYYDILGGDFVVNTMAKSAPGAVTKLKVIDSGFAFNNDETILFKKSGLPECSGIGKVSTNGKSKGRYKQKGGFLSDQKKIQDGYYYQNYSYEIRSSVPLIKYEEMLKKLLHVSGTKYFGAFIKQSEEQISISALQSSITVS